MQNPLEQPIPPIPEDTAIHERNFHHYTVEMSFPREEVAFAMVDIWDTGFGPAPLSHLGWEAEYNAGKSFCDRAGEIATTRILPMMETCREAGLAVVHIPTRDIAVKHTQWEALATEEERNPPAPALGSPRSSDWPPADWVKAWRQEHTRLFRTEPWITDYYAHVRPNQNIPTPLRPVDGDWVVSSGDMMHRLLAERGIRVLFYCGFATNMCLINKPGAILDMQNRGYMPIVIRDATTGTENAETLDGLRITHAMIDQIEMLYGYSITTSEFLSTLEAGGDLVVPCRYIRMYKPME
ncbi:MAG: cysteine hydrolase family protein [Candidatus Latescibacteria bacterium]|jgi:nicotinamidase-related amidase|nr:cysteine hydrolase family protein [Candidatus Latescibacterota bacterium]